MPSELHYIIFTGKEVAEAAIGLLAGHAVLAPGSKNCKATVEKMSAQLVLIRFGKDELGTRERRLLTSHEMIEAPIAWCRHRAVMLPLNAKKDLIQIGPVLCMPCNRRGSGSTRASARVSPGRDAAARAGRRRAGRSPDAHGTGRPGGRGLPAAGFRQEQCRDRRAARHPPP